MSLRHRVKRVEEAEKSTSLPFTTPFGWFDAWGECEVPSGIEGGRWIGGIWWRSSLPSVHGKLTGHRTAQIQADGDPAWLVA